MIKIRKLWLTIGFRFILPLKCIRLILFKHYLAPGTGLEKVDGMGAGCWLMSRELALALGPKPYSMSKATEDLVLSRKVMKLGYEMYVDWDINCLHLGVGAW